MTVYMPKVEESYVYASSPVEGEEQQWLVIIVPHGGLRPVTVETYDLAYYYDEERTQALRGRLRVKGGIE